MNEGTKLSTQNFKDLLVWQKGMILARMIYQITREFPADERFGLVVQMRQAAVSTRPKLQRDRHDTQREDSFSSSRTQKGP
jgi:four helix bundle protein